MNPREEFERTVNSLKEMTKQVWSKHLNEHYRAYRDHGPEKGAQVLRRLGRLREVQRNREFAEYWEGRGGAAGQGRG